MPLGLYVSVPFCKTKCSYCNFASDVFSRTIFQRYVDRLGYDLDHAPQTAANQDAEFEPLLDSIFLGGGTPTVLESSQFEAVFSAIDRNFQRRPDTEITVECAPGTLSPALLESFRRCGVNRVSLGVQSFVDPEAAAVGRIHKNSTVTEDIRRLRESGISNLNLDLIAGLPHQTSASWEFSLEQAIATGVPHLSVYMLEVDQDSRLGREVLAGGTRYHAHFVPDDDLTSDFYVAACEKLNTAGVQQYEISNFARPGFESKHNLKYWTRQPYMGFGVDAHSMLYSRMGGSVSPHPAAVQPGPGRLAGKAIRFANPESLDEFLRAAPLRVTPVSIEAAMEETFFLGLRLNRGLELAQIDLCFGREALAACGGVIAELREQGLLDQTGSTIRLSARGRLLSNEVFEAFLALTSR